MTDYPESEYCWQHRKQNCDCNLCPECGDLKADCTGRFEGCVNKTPVCTCAFLNHPEPCEVAGHHYVVKPKRLKLDKYIVDTAKSHKAADDDCGRKWECTCAACIQVREGITKSEWLKRFDGVKALDMCALKEML